MVIELRLPKREVMFINVLSCPLGLQLTIILVVD